MEKTCVADSSTPQWIIVGLGNPGSEHKYNRHNAGFLCIDALANKAVQAVTTVLIASHNTCVVRPSHESN